MNTVLKGKVSNFSLVTQEGEGVHWFWWIFWLLVFWPAVVLVAIAHSKKCFIVNVEYASGGNEVVRLSKEEYYRLFTNN